MNEGLYFIPIIERALKEPDATAALEKAFGETKRKGAQERYAEGFKNFALFMEIAYSHHKAAVSDHVRRLIAELATGTFDAAERERKLLLDAVNSRPDWKAEYETFCHEHAAEDFVRDLNTTTPLEFLASSITCCCVSSYRSSTDMKNQLGN